MQAVAKVTPSGQVVLDNGDRYGPDGYRFGDRGSYTRHYLRPAADVEHTAAQSALRDAWAKLMRRAEELAGNHGVREAVKHATPMTPAERAELEVIILRCCGAVPDAGSDGAE